MRSRTSRAVTVRSRSSARTSAADDDVAAKNQNTASARSIVCEIANRRGVHAGSFMPSLQARNASSRSKRTGASRGTGTRSGAVTQRRSYGVKSGIGSVPFTGRASAVRAPRRRPRIRGAEPAQDLVGGLARRRRPPVRGRERRERAVDVRFEPRARRDVQHRDRGETQYRRGQRCRVERGDRVDERVGRRFCSALRELFDAWSMPASPVVASQSRTARELGSASRSRRLSATTASGVRSPYTIAGRNESRVAVGARPTTKRRSLRRRR